MSVTYSRYNIVGLRARVGDFFGYNIQEGIVGETGDKQAGWW